MATPGCVSPTGRHAAFSLSDGFPIRPRVPDGLEIHPASSNCYAFVSIARSACRRGSSSGRTIQGGRTGWSARSRATC